VISDGWSTGILIKDVKALYKHFSAGEASPFADLTIQYADYACWQREVLQGELLDGHLRSWEKQLAGVQPVLKLSIARPRPQVQSSRGASRSLPLSSNLSEQIRSFSKKEGVTLFMTLLAAFRTLLLRYSGQEDIVVGSPTANRDRREIEELIGFFVNVFTLRTDLSGTPSFRELLGRVRKVTLVAHAHRDAPFEKIVSHLQSERAEAYAPLFQNVFTFQNMSKPEFDLPGLRLSYIPVTKGTTHHDLHLDVTETPDGLVAGASYRTDLFDGDSIEHFLRRYVNLLKEVAAQPDWRLLHVPLDPGAKESSIRPSIVESTYQHQQFSF
jgi:non-ribosomal peptide synthetase component F